jgi:hypothetical protein
LTGLPASIIIYGNIIIYNNVVGNDFMDDDSTAVPKIDLIIHPARFRILQTLTGERLTTQEIAERLPDIAKSSIYRYLRMLLDGDVVQVVETRLVNGIQEKVYTLTAVPHISAEEMAHLTAEDHLGYFNIYALTLLQGFADYLQAAEASGPLDLYRDKVGYSEAIFFATPEEMEQFRSQLQAMLQTLRQNEGRNGREKRKFALISHPIPAQSESQTKE